MTLGGRQRCCTVIIWAWRRTSEPASERATLMVGARAVGVVAAVPVATAACVACRHDVFINANQPFLAWSLPTNWQAQHSTNPAGRRIEWDWSWRLGNERYYDRESVGRGRWRAFSYTAGRLSFVACSLLCRHRCSPLLIVTPTDAAVAAVAAAAVQRCTADAAACLR